MNLGDTSVQIISDGTFLMDGGAIFGQVPKTIWETSVKSDRRNRIRLGLNCLLIQMPNTNILVDTGSGSKRMDRLKDAYGLNGNKLLKVLLALSFESWSPAKFVNDRDLIVNYLIIIFDVAHVYEYLHNT